MGTLYIYFSETLLYVCFCLVAGAVFLNFIPVHKKPDIRISPTLLFNLFIAIALLSFVPVIRGTLFFTDEEFPFWNVLPDVLADLELGRAWVWILIQSTIILFIMAMKDIQKNVLLNGIVALLLVGIMFSYGWASHAAGQSQSFGFLAESLHLIAISLWIGIIIIVGWFARGSDNWSSFIRWFSPLSIGCVLVVIAAGLTLMFYIVPDYVSSWIITYGQALLIKHLLFIPLLVFGYLNGFLMNRRLLTQSNFDPRSWLKGESLFAVLIFAITAFMGVQTPPHEGEGTTEPIASSPLFQQFYPDILKYQFISLNWSWPAVVFTLAGLVILFVIIKAYRRISAWSAVGLGLMFVLTGYVALMFWVG